MGERPEEIQRIDLGSSVLEGFAEVIGETAAIRLSSAFGGRQIYIPHRPRSDSELVQVIGDLAAAQLAKRFGGLSYTVPITAGKWARIIELRKEERTVRDIADQVGCSERYVYQVLASYKERGGSLDSEPEPRDPDQWDLFERGG